MKKFILLALMSCSISMAQEGEAQAAIEKFFTAFHAQDTIALRSVMSDQMVFHSISEGRSTAKLSTESASDFIKSIAGMPNTMKFEERILSWKIQIDGPLAHIWTPYEFYIDGKLSHRGVNSFQLFKDIDGWKIVHCIDTRKK